MTEKTKMIERNLGTQPIAAIMEERELKPHDLVIASTEMITHRMVTKACQGRRLTSNVKCKVRNALNLVTEGTYSIADLFTY